MRRKPKGRSIGTPKEKDLQRNSADDSKFYDPIGSEADDLLGQTLIKEGLVTWAKKPKKEAESQTKNFVLTNIRFDRQCQEKLLSALSQVITGNHI